MCIPRIVGQNIGAATAAIMPIVVGVVDQDDIVLVICTDERKRNCL